MKQVLFLIISFSFNSVIAQQNAHVIPTNPYQKDVEIVLVGNYAGGTREGVSSDELKRYQDIINRTKTPEMSWRDFKDKITSSDRDKLESIFIKMSRLQQRQETVVFFKPMPPLKRVVPTQKQFSNFKNSKIYGVWINEKKVPNSTLNKYVPKDFAHVFISKLYGPAKKGRDYSYQVDLMTNRYYQVYYEKAIADKSTIMFIQDRRPIKN